MRTLNIGGSTVVVLEDELAVSREVAARVVAATQSALDAHGTAHVALTGGSSAVAMHHELSRPPFSDALDWRDVHFWWGDDRFVPRDHPESNAGMAMRTLFADPDVDEPTGILVDADNLHPMPCEEAIARGEGPDWAAATYAADLKRFLPRAAEGVPGFDLILLGIGSDGHTLSVFPGSPGLAPDAPIVMGVPAPTHIEPYLRRVTFSTRMLAPATQVLVFTAGAAKAEMLSHVLGAESDLGRWPVQAALLPNAVWLLDEAAASKLG